MTTTLSENLQRSLALVSLAGSPCGHGPNAMASTAKRRTSGRFKTNSGRLWN